MSVRLMINMVARLMINGTSKESWQSIFILFQIMKFVKKSALVQVMA